MASAAGEGTADQADAGQGARQVAGEGGTSCGCSRPISPKCPSSSPAASMRSLRPSLLPVRAFSSQKYVVSTTYSVMSFSKDLRSHCEPASASVASNPIVPSGRSFRNV